ncbi:AzlC family ABC transporter permease [Primorskyibacter sp. 2E107]|uniref:AzlC family ABC transporter permease n=1 Tax=Primorskyibacter sp. 2E107 TaxID=3403458 RepID=UPI003AF5F8D5
MAQSQVMSSYWRGARDATPFLLVVVPFAILFGVIATEAGLTVFETLSFSVVVIAGAAQFTAIQLMTDNAPTIVVLVSALAVNLRMAMYSASITPHLGPLPFWKRAIVGYFLVDQTYAASMLEYERVPKMSVTEKFAYFLGVASPICPPWYAATVAGAYMGNIIPANLGLDMVLPIAFLAMLGPALRSRAHIFAALAATVLALVFAWVPYNLGLIIAGIGGMMVGAETERRLAR